jgi:aminoglycoside phosphotransferase (APT) family kinase protein
MLTPPASLELAELRPFAGVTRRIDSALWLSPDDRNFLRARFEQLAKRYEQLAFVLPHGVIHGEASVGNVIGEASGQAVLIDLDGFAIGPREWDLVLTAMYYDSFSWHTQAEYEQFAAVYECDVMEWAGYPVLREIREFLMVTWLRSRRSANCATRTLDGVRSGWCSRWTAAETAPSPGPRSTGCWSATA